MELQNFLSHLKSSRAQIQNLNCLPPNILLGPVFTPKREGFAWQVCVWWPSWIFKCSYLSGLESYMAEIWNLSFISLKHITGTYLDTKLSRFGLADSLIVAILDF